jgi:hypothetical protein
MRYRLMATYRGVPYEAGVGPSGSDVVLYAACPPPEELGFEPATGHWRKRVIRAEVDALWESRPVGTFRDEPCIVLDDLGDRLHIAYLGADAGLAASLGYWQVDRGVFELLTPREEVTGLIEERIEKPLRLASPTGPAATQSSYPYQRGPDPDLDLAPDPSLPLAAPDPLLPLTAPDLLLPRVAADPAPARELVPDGGGRAARRQRVQTRDIFCELTDLAAIPRTAYALETEIEGALCLMAGPDGFEVFMAMDGARHEARSFPDEEAAYFYLFGVLAAEAVRNGALLPAVAPAGTRHDLS